MSLHAMKLLCLFDALTCTSIPTSPSSSRYLSSHICLQIFLACITTPNSMATLQSSAPSLGLFGQQVQLAGNQKSLSDLFDASLYGRCRNEEKRDKEFSQNPRMNDVTNSTRGACLNTRSLPSRRPRQDLRYKWMLHPGRLKRHSTLERIDH